MRSPSRRSCFRSPSGDEFFHVDLIGCAVRSGDRELGTVHDVLAYPANDVLEVRADDGLGAGARSPLPRTS